MRPPASASTQRISLLLLALSLPTPSSAQLAVVSGTVRDSGTTEPVSTARVYATAPSGRTLVTRTDMAGSFRFSAVEPGEVALRVVALGYRPATIAGLLVSANEVRTLRVVLARLAILIDEVVVTASRVDQSTFDAPASVSVVDEETLLARTALTVADHLRDVRGLDMATTGLTQHGIVARGFNGASSGRLLSLVDFRYASVPSLRINAFNFVPTANDDVERIEVVRGPGAALYGPNSADGVLHVITRSPLESPGTVVTLTGGERSLFHTSVRSAARLASDVGIKLSLQYLRADDWPFVDTIEVKNRRHAISRGEDPRTLLVGLRDPRVERVAGDVRIDIQPAVATRLTVSAGVNDAINNLDITPVGAAQVRDWRYLYVQGRLRHRGFWANLFLNTSDAGDTYLLRNGNPIVDDSRHIVGQLQQAVGGGSPARVTFGLDAQRTVPRTGGTIMGRNETHDQVDEAGGYVQIELRPAPILGIIAAGRADYHNRLEDPVFSPRAGVVLRPALAHGLRFTYNRGYGTPSADNLFLDLAVGPLPVPEFIVRTVGVPSSGFTFRRNCSGICMRSPFWPTELGGPAKYLPLDATPLWPVIVEILAESGIDIRSVPPPARSEIATVMGLLDPAAEMFVPVEDARDVPRLKPTITQTFEMGYQGVFGSRVLAQLDVYHTVKQDFLGPLRVETPNAFFDSATTAAYLARFLPAPQAELLAREIARIPVASVTPQEARDPTDILMTVRNFGDISLWGIDAALTLYLNPDLVLIGSYSWASQDLFPVGGGFPDLALNAPKHKGSIVARYDNRRHGVLAEAQVRAVSGFPVRSGVYDGNVSAYGLVDGSLAWRLPAGRGLTVSVTAQNLLDHHHQEFAGTPAIGRLILGRVRAEF